MRAWGKPGSDPCLGVLCDPHLSAAACWSFTHSMRSVHSMHTTVCACTVEQSEMCLSEVRLSGVCLNEVCLSEVCLNDVCLSEVCLWRCATHVCRHCRVRAVCIHFLGMLHR